MNCLLPWDPLTDVVSFLRSFVGNTQNYSQCCEAIPYTAIRVRPDRHAAGKPDTGMDKIKAGTGTIGDPAKPAPGKETEFVVDSVKEGFMCSR